MYDCTYTCRLIKSTPMTCLWVIHEVNSRWQSLRDLPGTVESVYTSLGCFNGLAAPPMSKRKAMPTQESFPALFTAYCDDNDRRSVLGVFSCLADGFPQGNCLSTSISKQHCQPFPYAKDALTSQMVVRAHHVM